MTLEQLRRAQELDQEIKDVIHFLRVIDPKKDVKRGGGKHDISAIFRVKTSKSIKISSYRDIGMGCTHQEVKLPNTLLPELYTIFSIRLKSLESELNNI